MSMVFSARFCVTLACIITLANACEYDGETCEWKKAKLQWRCPDGYTREVRAFWGRESGDETTCTEGVAGKYLDTNCTGDDEKARKAVIKWCDAKVRKEDGTCSIRASGRVMKYDPCPGVFKYLQVCTSCIKPEPVGLNPSCIPSAPVTLSAVFKLEWLDAYSNQKKYNELVRKLTQQFAVIWAPHKVVTGYSDVTLVTADRRANSNDFMNINVTVALTPDSGMRELTFLMIIMQSLPVAVSGQKSAAYPGKSVAVIDNKEYGFTHTCSLFNALKCCLNGGFCHTGGGGFYMKCTGSPIRCCCRDPYGGRYCEATST